MQDALFTVFSNLDLVIPILLVVIGIFVLFYLHFGNLTNRCQLVIVIRLAMIGFLVLYVRLTLRT